MGFTDIGGVALHHSVQGHRRAMPVVFINSLGTDLRIWDGVVPYLADRFRIVRYDKRGHGLSDWSPAPNTIRTHTNDLVGLLDSLQIDETLVVGISVGGMIALDLAATYPRRVRAQVLCGTGPKIGTAEMWNERIQTLRENGMDTLSDAILSRWFTVSFAQTKPAAYRGYRNMLSRTPVAGYTSLCEAIRDADLTEAVTAIRTKSLVLCGAEDVATPPELVGGMAKRMPQAQFSIIEEAAHLPCIEQPDVMAAHIMRFFEENGYVV